MTALKAARAASRQTGDSDALVAALPYARFLGLRLHRQDDGRLLAQLPFRAGLIGNPRVQALHGGVTAAFMEAAATLTVLERLEPARVPKAIDFSIDYLLPGRPQDLWADCQIGRIGSRVAQASVRCWQASAERPIAIARLHLLLAAAGD